MTLNGIDVDGLRTALAAVGAQPEAALARRLMLLPTDRVLYVGLFG